MEVFQGKVACFHTLLYICDEYYMVSVFIPKTSPKLLLNTSRRLEFFIPFSLLTNEAPTLSQQIKYKMRNKNMSLLIGESVIPVSRMKDDKVFYLKILAHFKLGKY
jgi:hypothetical protein